MSSASPLDHGRLQGALRAGRFEWRRHVLERLAERGISQASVLAVLSTGDRIEDYPEDQPYASALFFKWAEGRPLHVLVAFDEENGWAYVITAYEADLEHFEPDFRTRRRDR